MDPPDCLQTPLHPLKVIDNEKNIVLLKTICL